MKHYFKKSLQELLAERYLLVILSLLVILALGLAVYVGFAANPGEQVISRYSAFGISHIYKAQWFYLLIFGLFGLVTALSYAAVVAKVLTARSRSLAYLFAWLGVGVLILTFIISNSVINALFQT